MFGGFVQLQGTLSAIIRKGDLSELSVSHSSPDFTEKLCIGRSVAVNGVCLTVIAFSQNSFTVECSHETMKKTMLGNLVTGTQLNLELPITLNTLLDGHIVSGHIDTVGKLKKVSIQSDNVEMTFTYDQEFSQYVVEKGSITVNGISLTAFNVTDTSFTVSVIPHTFRETNLKLLRENSPVNLEFDLIGKYVLNKTPDNAKGLTMEVLAKNGFL